MVKVTHQRKRPNLSSDSDLNNYISPVACVVLFYVRVGHGGIFFFFWCVCGYFVQKWLGLSQVA